MTTEEILKAVKVQARLGGWYRNLIDTDSEIGKMISSDPAVIFSHSFAKAYFGTKPNVDEFEEHELGKPLWECGLQTMVLKKDPILYLEQFLCSENQ